MTSIIINASCLTLGQTYSTPFFKATVTSPPYKKKEGYSKQLMLDLARQLLPATLDGGFAFINFASLAEDWGRPFEVYGCFVEAGWKPVTTLIWVKSMVFPAVTGALYETVEHACDVLAESLENKRADTLSVLFRPRQVGHYTPIDVPGRLNNLFEYIHVFSKGDAIFDKLTPPNGVEYTDMSNLLRGTRGKNGNRHDSGNVFFCPYRTTGNKEKKKHAYEYPEEVVERCLRLARCQPRDNVLDPFAGSGTTLAVAKKLGMNGIGYEIDSEIASEANRRLAAIPERTTPSIPEIVST